MSEDHSARYVDAVAKAMWTKLGPVPPLGSPLAWDKQSDRTRQLWRRHAREVLEYAEEHRS